MKDDTISRAAAIDALEQLVIPEDMCVFEILSHIELVIGTLPSAQPECEDAVSRFEVLRLIDYSSNDLNDSVDNWYFQGKVKELPSVTPKQPGWIPVTERLPKKDGDYLVTTHSGQIARYIFIGGSSEEYWRRCVTAWMPLPAPWEGGQE